MQVFGWNLNGLVIFNDVVCSQNTAGGYGGCFRNGGTSYINNGTVMHGNVGLNGGCICERDVYSLRSSEVLANV